MAPRDALLSVLRRISGGVQESPARGTAGLGRIAQVPLPVLASIRPSGQVAKELMSAVVPTGSAGPASTQCLISADSREA